jgi:hypothetical protein
VAFLISWLRFWCGWQIGGCSQQLKTEWQKSRASTVGQKAEVADANEAGGKHVKQEAAQELLDRQGHQALLVAVSGVSPAEGDLATLQRNEAMVRDGDSMRVTAQVTENVVRATEGRFAVDHPVLTEERTEEGREGLRFRQELQLTVEASWPSAKARRRAATNLPRKTRRSTFTGRKKR